MSETTVLPGTIKKPKEEQKQADKKPDPPVKDEMAELVKKSTKEPP